MPILRATARLQFHQHFGFDAAVDTVDYFAALGISHLYASPIFTAQPGSTHGYDVTDPCCINPELGGEAGLRRLAARLHAAGMGLIIDIVPNHMGIAGGHNPWWQHVLEWGRASPHADWFDIDWVRPDPAIHGKVLLPFLGDQYGAVLAAGEIVLRLNATAGQIFAGYHDNRFPIAVDGYAAILRHAASPLLAPVIAAFVAPHGTTLAASAGAMALLAQVAATPDGLAAIESALACYNAAGGAALLHALLEAQHYRLAWWRSGADSLNWRRFFEVTDLAGMRVELPAVFDATHALMLRLYAEGLIDGVRVDHVDGLADPGGYCRQLRARLAACAGGRPQDDAGPAIILVEKILADGEQLRSDWQVDGTTGYDFMDQVGAFLHAPQGAAELTRAWHDLQPAGSDFAAEVQAARRQLLAHNLATEFEAACQALLDLARAVPATRDHSANAIRRVFAELLVQFPVYRTYVHEQPRTGVDSEAFALAMARTNLHVAPADLALLAQLDAWLGGSMSDDAVACALQARAIRRFQQLTPPLVAKSVEDTAFYRYGRLLSRNQVGSDPGQFALSAEGFHAACAARAAAFPLALLATATHDHKRGEDVTARLAVLSEVPREWRACVQRWRAMNARHRTSGTAPCAADEAMLYQTLAGIWPIGLDGHDRAGVAALRERVAMWQQKALREAKTNTDWTTPNTAYEQACSDFLEAILAAPNHNLFVDELVTWVRAITPPGIVNSLTQTVLRLTVPGVPDLYQGTDLWDFSLVDPDNRRAVDFAARKTLLAGPHLHPAQLIPWHTGALKQRLIRDALQLRLCLPDLFASGSYQPLEVTGPRAENIVAFLRRHEGNDLIVIVTRLVAALSFGKISPAIDGGTWTGTRIVLPADAAKEWCSVFDGGDITAAAGAIPVDRALATLTVAILCNRSRAGSGSLSDQEQRQA